MSTKIIKSDDDKTDKHDILDNFNDANLSSFKLITHIDFLHEVRKNIIKDFYL